MTSLTEKEEGMLDRGWVRLKRDGFTLDIHSNEVICYGEIDFSYGSDDYETLSQMHWLNHLVTRGIDIPSNYDYDKACYIQENGRVLWYDSTNCADVAQYMHVRLGKPKRTVIFKRKVKANGRRVETL